MSKKTGDDGEIKSLVKYFFFSKLRFGILRGLLRLLKSWKDMGN